MSEPSYVRMKVIVVKNVGKESIECFGEVGTIHSVEDNSIFTDLTGYVWESLTEAFLSIEALNKYFAKLVVYETLFALAE